MARSRSPNYPAVPLEEALTAIRQAYKKESRNKMSREVLAQHLGYSGLNGRSLGMIGALRAYGLIEGSGDELRIAEDAITVLEAPADSTDRNEALARLAFRPNLFQEIRSEFQTSPSEANLRFWLIKRAFTSEAAAKAAKTYLDTIALVGDYGEVAEETEPMIESPSDALRNRPAEQPLPAGNRKAVFPVSEGDVTIIFPANLSEEGFQELEAYLGIFLKRSKGALG